MIDAGASLVFASGPHTLRGIEWYHGHLIAYSLGNLAGKNTLSTEGTLVDQRAAATTLGGTLLSAGSRRHAAVVARARRPHEAAPRLARARAQGAAPRCARTRSLGAPEHVRSRSRGPLVRPAPRARQEASDRAELPRLSATAEHGPEDSAARHFLPCRRSTETAEPGSTLSSMAVVERHHDLVDELIAEVEAYKPDADRELLTRAFQFAARAHEGQLRRSGQEFIYHPWGVAKILAGLRLDEATLAAALLHDTVEDTGVAIEDIRAEFGEEIAKLVEGVTKLTRVQFQSREHAEAENYRKLIVAMAEDVRVILIKLADRLHNLRTIEYMGKQTQVRKAKETLEVYAPLAHRLGIHALKWELEDLAFQTLHPRKYEEIKQMVAERRADREEHVREASMVLQRELDKVDVPAEISGRAKHFYSIYDKMAKKGREFNEIYDLTAMRVIVERDGDEGTRDCYGALGLIHSLWKPMPGRFKDYIAMPKLNGYRALHTTVIGPQGRPLEIQVRTREMHATAEYGIAAHWLYKRAGRKAATTSGRTWVEQLMDAGSDEADPREFMKSFRTDLFEDEVHVFTPKGQVKTLPAGVDADRLRLRRPHRRRPPHGRREGQRPDRPAPLPAQERRLRRDPDLEARAAARRATGCRSRRARARAARSGSGSRARRARIRSRRAARRSSTRSRRRTCPTRSSARRRVLAAGDPRLGLQEGGGLLRRARLGEAPDRRDRQQGDPAPEDGAGGRGGAGRQGAEGAQRRLEREMGVVVQGVDDVLVRLAKCCTPVPGDAIVGYISLGKGITIHRDDCPNVKALMRNAERFTPVEWDGDVTKSFRVQIAVDSWDRPRLLEDVARTFAEHGANIVAYGGVVEDQLAKNWYTAEVGDVKALRSLMNALRGIDAVFDAYRVTPSYERVHPVAARSRRGRAVRARAAGLSGRGGRRGSWRGSASRPGGRWSISRAGRAS